MSERLALDVASRDPTLQESPRTNWNARWTLGPSRFPPTISWLIGTAGLLALAVALIGVFRVSADPTQFPVSEVEVLGTLDYTDRSELRDMVIDQTRNGFYRLNIDAIRRNITQLPWVAEAHIRRVWPDRLSIDVVEHEPAARWNDDALISKRFEMFKPPQLKKDSIQRAEWQAFFSRFPQLGGVTGRHEAVLNGFRRMQSLMTPYQVDVESLIEDDRHSQTLVLGNNVTVRLGAGNIDERIDRFISIYATLIEPLQGRAVELDMRYANGFSMSRFDVTAGRL